MERSAGWSCQPFPSSFLSFHRPISTDSYRRERSKQGKHLPFTRDGWVRLVFHLPDPSTTRVIQQPPLQTTVWRYGLAPKQARARVPLSCLSALRVCLQLKLKVSRLIDHTHNRGSEAPSATTKRLGSTVTASILVIVYYSMHGS